MGAALARHGGHQGERLRSWAGRGRARARIGRLLRGGAGRRGAHAACRRHPQAHRAARGGVRSRTARCRRGRRFRARGAHRGADRIAARGGSGRALQGVAQARQRHESPGVQGRGLRCRARDLERLARRSAIAGQSLHAPGLCRQPGTVRNHRAAGALCAGHRFAPGRAQHRQFRRHAEFSRGAGRLGAARIAAVRRLPVQRHDRRGLRTASRR